MGLKMNRSSCALWLQLGRSYMSLDDQAGAIKSLEKAAKLVPESSTSRELKSEVFEELGKGYLTKGAVDSAIRVLDRGLTEGCATETLLALRIRAYDSKSRVSILKPTGIKTIGIQGPKEVGRGRLY